VPEETDHLGHIEGEHEDTHSTSGNIPASFPESISSSDCIMHIIISYHHNITYIINIIKLKKEKMHKK
jgi:hypothetical protein